MACTKKENTSINAKVTSGVTYSERTHSSSKKNVPSVSEMRSACMRPTSLVVRVWDQLAPSKVV